MLSSFQSLGLKGGREHVGQLVLLSDTITDGSFLVYYFISQALKDGHQAVLVSLTQSLLHYSSVCSKLGVNLHSKREEGTFVFVDGLTTLLSDAFSSQQPVTVREGTASAASSDASDQPNWKRKGERITISLGSDCSLDGVFDTLQQLVTEAHARESKPGKPVCLIIDGLSVLLNVGVALSRVVLLVQMCMHMLTSSHGPCQGEGYLVLMVHCEEGEGEPEELLHKHLLHLCHLHLQAKGLTTGYSKDVHGKVSVSWRDPVCGGQVLLPQQTAQYKLTDKSLQIFGKGMSKAIL